MPKYRLHYGKLGDFYAQTAGEVVPYLREHHMLGDDSEGDFILRLAMEMCEWNGKNYYFQTRDALGASMMRHGLMEVVD